MAAKKLKKISQFDEDSGDTVGDWLAREHEDRASLAGAMLEVLYSRGVIDAEDMNRSLELVFEKGFTTDDLSDAECREAITEIAEIVRRLR